MAAASASVVYRSYLVVHLLAGHEEWKQSDEAVGRKVQLSSANDPGSPAALSRSSELAWLLYYLRSVGGLARLA